MTARRRAFPWHRRGRNWRREDRRREPAVAGYTTTYAGCSGIQLDPGETAKTVVVSVKGDTAVEPDEVFKLKLSDLRKAVFADDVGRATIRNDD